MGKIVARPSSLGRRNVRGRPLHIAEAEAAAVVVDGGELTPKFVVAGERRGEADELAGDADRWFAPYAPGQVQAALGANMAAMGTMVLGRRTYEIFFGAFAGQQNPVADIMNSTPKVVVSTTLEKADWNNSTVIGGDVVATLNKLKTESEKDVRVVGSLSLIRQLLAQRALDELELFVHPIVLGHGERLFDESLRELMLAVASSETFDNGVIHVIYRPAEEETRRS